jgi:putative CocE/NonD family hydrolase
VPTRGGLNLTIDKGPMDQREVESRQDVLVFTSEPLTEPLEITGRITAVLSVSSDGQDTDFTVKLTDVYPDGKSLLVADGIRRASLRNSFEKREPLEPGEVYEVPVDLWSTSLIVNTGHRLRVAVSSSNSPRFEPNPNTGEPRFETGKSRVAKNTLHMSSARLSRIELPVVKPR